MREIIVRYNDGNDHMAVRGGEYVQDLVRCGKCRKANTMECINRAYNEKIDKWEIWYMGDDWFCADGERREP